MLSWKRAGQREARINVEVLLLQDVDNLGKAGEVKRVAGGYARNYLIPNRLAVVATPAALKQAEGPRTAAAGRRQLEEDRARQLADRIAGITLTLAAKAGEQDRLYGSITNADIAEALGEALGEPVDKRKIILEEPIKTLGGYQVPVRLSADLVPQVTVLVERETGASGE